jgi:hypothetical protein
LNFQLVPVEERSEEISLIGWNIVPHTGHFAPFIREAFVALSAKDCCFAMTCVSFSGIVM